MLSRRTELRLRDIIEDAQRIATFIGALDLDAFRASEITLLAVERLLQPITEAAVQIDALDLSSLGPDFPIAQMRAFGNRLRHEYRDIDPAVIFDVARINVPALKAAAERALNS